MKKAIVALIITIIFAGIAKAEISNEIRYTARLKGYTSLITTQKTVKFEYYSGGNGDGGGTYITSESISVIPNAQGIFTAILNPSIPYNVWRAGNIWLQISVDNKPLLPREKLMAQPYAIHSKTAENGVPVGSVIAFAGPISNAPEGYLLCNGAEKSISEFESLAAVLNGAYNKQGVQAGKFNLPDFQGMFLRGAGSQTINYQNFDGTGKNYDSITHTAAAIGSPQGTSIRNITGTHEGLDNNGRTTIGVFYYAAGGRAASGGSDGWSVGFDASRVVPTAAENRPANYAVNYYIKY